MLKSHIPKWASLVLLGLGLLVVGIPGLFVYIRATAPKLHPNARDVPSVAIAQPAASRAAAVEQSRGIVRTSLSEQNLPGVSVAVGAAGEIVWAEGFGFANFENSLPVTPDDRFPTGTAATVFTSAALGLLLEEGRIRLDDEIQAYVPALPQKQWPLTVRQLMGNVGGAKVEDWDEGILISKHCARPADALDLFANEPLLFQPGSQFAFSTFGWALLSAALETAADKPYATFLDDRVFRPLGMHDTVKVSAPNPVPNEVTFYETRFLSRPAYGASRLRRNFDYSCHAGSSGFLSTPSDMVRFAMAINSGKLVRRDTVQLLQTSQRTASGMETGYGLGWELKPVTIAGQTVRTIGHNGDFWGGPVASLLAFPDYGMAVAVMSNISHSDTFGIAVKIAGAFLEHGGAPPPK